MLYDTSTRHFDNKKRQAQPRRAWYLARIYTVAQVCIFVYFSLGVIFWRDYDNPARSTGLHIRLLLIGRQPAQPAPPNRYQTATKTSPILSSQLRRHAAERGHIVNLAPQLAVLARGVAVKLFRGLAGRVTNKQCGDLRYFFGANGNW